MRVRIVIAVRRVQTPPAENLPFADGGRGGGVKDEAPVSHRMEEEAAPLGVSRVQGITASRGSTVQIGPGVESKRWVVDNLYGRTVESVGRKRGTAGLPPAPHSVG